MLRSSGGGTDLDMSRKCIGCSHRTTEDLYLLCSLAYIIFLEPILFFYIDPFLLSCCVSFLITCRIRSICQHLPKSILSVMPQCKSMLHNLLQCIRACTRTIAVLSASIASTHAQSSPSLCFAVLKRPFSMLFP